MTHSRFLPVQLGLCLLALGCNSDAPWSVQVICTETPAYSSRWGSESQGSAAFGARVRVLGASFSDRLQIVEALSSNVGRYLSESCVAPYPLKGEPRWIQADSVSVERPIGTVPQQVSSTKNFGDAVEALTPTDEPWGRPGSIALLYEGAFLGFVPAEAVGEKPPPVERYEEHLAAILTRSEFPQAELLARRAFEAFPKKARLQRLLQALVALNGSEPPTTLGALPGLASLPDLPVASLLTLSEEEQASSEGPRVYSAAVGLRVRQEPKASAKALSILNANQPLELRSIDGDWAEVIAYPGRKVEVSGGEVEFVDQPPVTGYAALRFLSRTQLEPWQLLAQGKESLSAGRPEEAIVLLHRALASAASLRQTPSSEAQAALVQASFASGRYESLFQWLTALKQQPAQQDVESQRHPILLFGCHGKLAKARVYDLSERYGTWGGPEEAASVMEEPHACIGNIDLREPMEPQAMCPNGECENPSELHFAQSTYSRVLRPMHRKWSNRLSERFDSSAYLYFLPRQIAERPDGKLLLFYSIPLEGGSSDLDTFSATLFKDRASVTELTFPRAADWSQLEVWVRLPDYLDYEYGLALADSQAQVEEWLQQREDQFDYESFRSPDGKADDAKVRESPFPVIRLPSLPSRDYENWWRRSAIAEEY